MRLITRADGVAARRRLDVVGEMAADGVHLGDVGAALEQRGVDRLLAGEGNALGRQRQQRRAAARDQAEHEVVRTCGPRDLEHAGGGGAPGLVGDRMRGLDDLDPLAGTAWP